MDRKVYVVRYLALALVVLGISGCVTAQQGAMSRAYSGIEKEKYDFALKRLRDAER